MASTVTQHKWKTFYYVTVYKFSNEARQTILSSFHKHPDCGNARCTYRKSDDIFEMQYLDHQERRCIDALKKIVQDYIELDQWHRQHGMGVPTVTRIDEVDDSTWDFEDEDGALASSAQDLLSSWAPKDPDLDLEAFVQHNLVVESIKHRSCQLTIDSNNNALKIVAADEEEREKVYEILTAMESIIKGSPIVEHIIKTPSNFGNNDKLAFVRLRDMEDGSLGRLLLPDDFSARDFKAVSRSSVLKIMKFHRQYNAYHVETGEIDDVSNEPLPDGRALEMFDSMPGSGTRTNASITDNRSNLGNKAMEPRMQKAAAYPASHHEGEASQLESSIESMTISGHAGANLREENANDQQYVGIRGPSEQTIVPVKSGVEEGILIDLDSSETPEPTPGAPVQLAVSESSASVQPSSDLPVDRLAPESEYETRVLYRTTRQRSARGRRNMWNRPTRGAGARVQNAQSSLRAEWEAEQAHLTARNDFVPGLTRSPAVLDTATSSRRSDPLESEDPSDAQGGGQRSETSEQLIEQNPVEISTPNEKLETVKGDPGYELYTKIGKALRVGNLYPGKVTWKMEFGRILNPDIRKDNTKKPLEVFDTKGLMKDSKSFGTRNGAFTPRITSSKTDVVNLLKRLGLGSRVNGDETAAYWKIDCTDDEGKELTVIRYLKNDGQGEGSNKSQAENESQIDEVILEQHALGIVYFHNPQHVFDSRFVIEAETSGKIKVNDKVDKLSKSMTFNTIRGNSVPNVEMRDSPALLVDKITLVKEFTWKEIGHPKHPFCFKMYLHREYTIHRPVEPTPSERGILLARAHEDNTMVAQHLLWFEAAAEPCQTSTQKEAWTDQGFLGGLEQAMEKIVERMDSVGKQDRGPIYRKMCQLREAATEKGKQKAGKSFFW